MEGHTKNFITENGYMLNRIELYENLIPNLTNVIFTNGRNKDKFGTLISKSKLNNNEYYSKRIAYQFHNYFSVIVKVEDREIPTSCNNIKIM